MDEHTEPQSEEELLAEKAARKAARKAAKKEKRRLEAEQQSSDLPAIDASACLEAAKAGVDSQMSVKRKRDDSDSGAAPSWGTEFHVGVDDPIGTTWEPFTQFTDCRSKFGPKLMGVVAGFNKPTPIQAQTWPILLAGRDIVGLAATGSGKTLAFLLPALVKITSVPAISPTRPGPLMLVIAPTRELAQQTAIVAERACSIVGLRSACVYGGMPKGPQAYTVSPKNNGGVHILSGTPGRLLDLHSDGSLVLSNVLYLVLDEADRMLDMGFERDIRTIIAALPAAGPGRQTAMFSATWPTAIQGIAAEFLRKPVKVTIGEAAAAGQLAASHSVTQLVEVIQDPNARDARLIALLSQYHSSRKNRVLVFGLYKKECDRLERFLKGRGWACVAIHGDMSQSERNRSFEAFKSGTVPLLIATDVAARGLDIPNVECVINFTFPLTIEDYVHRIGRTGRAGATGIAVTLFTPLDKGHAGELVNILREASAPVPEDLLKFGTHIKKKEHSMYGAHFKGGAGGDGTAPPAAKRMTFE